jgi:hypothetical protein
MASLDSISGLGLLRRCDGLQGSSRRRLRTSERLVQISGPFRVLGQSSNSMTSREINFRDQ